MVGEALASESINRICIFPYEEPKQKALYYFFGYSPMESILNRSEKLLGNDRIWAIIKRKCIYDNHSILPANGACGPYDMLTLLPLHATSPF